MKQYPSVSREIVNGPMYAFGKYDGSNIRCEWDRKAGLHKFGSRKVLLGTDHPYLGKAEAIILAKYGDTLARIFAKERFEFVTCFFEFYGSSSFAGLHNPEDPDLTATLIDIDVYKKGMPLARDFLKLFEGKVEIPPMLYMGNPNAEFIESVRKGTLEGMPFEGVVCKGAPLKKGYQPYMFKVKSEAWIEKVKGLYGDDPAKLADLL